MRLSIPSASACIVLLVASVNAAEPPTKLDPGQHLDLRQGKQVYKAACARCHDKGSDGAPKLSNPKAWNQASVHSFSAMEDHAKRGFLNMPAEGEHSVLKDEDLANATFYILSRLEKRK
jgi:cytochrome c5